MKIVVSDKELRVALGEWLARNHPVLAGRPVHIHFDHEPLTPDEARALNCGLRLEGERGVRATIETVDA